MTNAVDDDDSPSAYSAEVGQRLRAVRKAREFSLDDVERKSGGRWSASAIGAYERGFRNLSLPRLRALAQFYDVPMTVLLGEPDEGEQPVLGASKLVVDLEALGRTPDAGPVSRYLRTIINERGDYNGRVLSVRRDDIRALCALLPSTESELYQTLGAWGALLSVDPTAAGEPAEGR
ncbi:MAG TPA: transcriptional regulator [Acidimicrobiales bacterium]|jgi:transcriptional regulator with XRE-family HTH domain